MHFRPSSVILWTPGLLLEIMRVSNQAFRGLFNQITFNQIARRGIRKTIKKFLPIGLGLFVLFTAVAIWEIPQWQANSLPSITKAPITPKERAEIENAFRGTLIQGLGGLFFILTAYFTWRNIQNAEEKQDSERFSKAVEMLGDKDKIEVRLGGIYSLEKIAKDSPKDYHWTIMEVLTSFIRENSPRFTNKEKQTLVESYLSEQDKKEADTKDPPRITTDIQAALTVIGRREVKNDEDEKLKLPLTNLSGADLSEAKLSGADLSGADLSKAKLRDAKLRDANLSYADLSKAKLSGADLFKADLFKADLFKAILGESVLFEAFFKKADLSKAFRRSGADLSEAVLTEAILFEAFLSKANLFKADLFKADLFKAKLRDAYLNEAVLSKANLSGAELNEAYLSGADLSGANLSDADLSGANLSDADLSGAIVESTTFGDNTGLSEEDKNNLKQRGAIFG